ncbi:Alpha-1,4-glucan:maltose-1-phosphate maltosyltransferase [compost metagenome]
MKQQGRLKQIHRFLMSNRRKEVEAIWIPSLWNQCGYTNVQDEHDGEIQVHPFDFIVHHLQYLFDSSSQYHLAETRNLDESVIYCSLVRYTTAWDYGHTGVLASGTFLRTMILLPLLKKMGVNILYLLPVTRYSSLNLKGDIGSPYAVHNLFELDFHLHDSLLDGMKDFTLHDEMAALVEACHLLDIKVVVDFIPRVTARNSVVIEEHPDWVYWIYLDQLEGFCPPNIPELGFFEECTPDKLDTIYRSDETADFLDKFSLPPNELDSALWESLKVRAKQTGEELLTLVEEEMGITTSPAHSDWINDVQPIWTDITFYRLFKDLSPMVKPYVSPQQAPYVLFDTIKCNYYPGLEPNRELWDMLIDAITFNLNIYGIDGFRIDIGHVLPTALLDEIFQKIKEVKPHAILISEDLFNRNHRKAAKTGYNIMLGSGWNMMTDIKVNLLQNYLRELPELEIPVFACSETADTPRITSRGGVKLARMMTVFNYFLPNAIPYLTTGMEVNEEQPLNCGLGDNTEGAEIPKAFFTKLSIHWTEPRTMIPLLDQLNQYRKEYSKLLQSGNFFVPDNQGDVLIYAYYQRNELFVGCFNLSSDTVQKVDLKAIYPFNDGFVLLIDSNSEPGTGHVGQRYKQFMIQPNQGMIFYHDKIRSGEE